MYRVEGDWEAHGLRCVVIMTDMGHRCGYVGVDGKHPLCGMDYNDHLPAKYHYMWEEVREGSVGKRGVLDLLTLDYENPRVGDLFDVHGGITFSGGQPDYPVQAELWWFGYDCAHAEDARDLSEIPDPRLRRIYERFPDGGEIRSLEYCVGECEGLAEHLSRLEGHPTEQAKKAGSA